MNDRDTGFIMGILAGEGHFGGDGKQPQVVLRMHVRSEWTCRFLFEHIPGSKMYGPYHHGSAPVRSYFQLMIRGETLRDFLVPLIRQNIDLFDPHVRGRFETMCLEYQIEEVGLS